MKIQVNSSDLLRCLSAVQKVMSNKNSLSILDSALLSETDGKYYITGGDIASSLTMPLPMAIIEGPFTPLCLNVKMLSSALGNIGGQMLNIDITGMSGGYNVQVQYLTGSFSFVAQSSEDYPHTPSISMDTEEEKAVTVQYQMPTAVMLSALRNALANTANEELRLVMNGVYLDATQEGNVTMVASDGHKMYKETYEHGIPFYSSALQNKGVILPKTVIPAVAEAFKGVQNLTLTANDNMIMLQATHDGFTTTLLTRSIEGRYPNYKSVIPQNHPYFLTVSRKDLVAAIKRVDLFTSDATHLIKLQYGSGMITLSGEDIDFSTAAQETLMPIAQSVPENFSIGFKADAMLTHLNYIASENVTIQLADRSIAMLVLPHDDVKGDGYVERIAKQTEKTADGAEHVTPAVYTNVVCLVMPMLVEN